MNPSFHRSPDLVDGRDRPGGGFGATLHIWDCRPSKCGVPNAEWPDHLTIRPFDHFTPRPLPVRRGAGHLFPPCGKVPTPPAKKF